jgi:hypothetical protein
MSKLMTTLCVLAVVFIAGCNKDGNWNNPTDPANLKTNTVLAPVFGSVPLGVSGDFVILSKAGITDVPLSVITGNIGTSPISGSAITGITCPEVTGTIYTVDASGPACRVISPVMLTTAVLDMQTAYTDAAGRAATSAATVNVGAGSLIDLTLAPGVYEWGTALSIVTDLTLNGTATDVWIFKVAGTLDIASAKSIILTGGALAQNIYWQVSGAVTLGTYSHFEGVILAMTNIAMQTGASINGRLLAQTAVTLDQNIITVSGTTGGGTTVPPVVCRDFVTGGGWINGTSNGNDHENGKNGKNGKNDKNDKNGNNEKTTFGVSGGLRDSVYWGQLTFNDHKGVSVKSINVTNYIVVDAQTRQIEGLALVNGKDSVAYTVIVKDKGEKGRNDSFSLQLSNGYSVSGTLGGGNIQLHMKCSDSENNNENGDKEDHFDSGENHGHNNGSKEEYSDKDENDGNNSCNNHGPKKS